MIDLLVCVCVCQSVHQSLSAECLFVEEHMEDSQLLLDDTVSLTEELTNTTAVRETLRSYD